MDDNEIVQSSTTINWGTMNIKKELSRRLDKEVVIENDVNLMTIGEHYKGQAKNIKDFVYFFIGNGIGSGLFLDGSFYKGYHRSEEHTSELQSRGHLVCRLLLEKKKQKKCKQ